MSRNDHEAEINENSELGKELNNFNFSENVSIPNFRNAAGVERNNVDEPHVVTLFPSKLERRYSEELKHSKKNGFLDVMRQFIIIGLLIAIFCGFLFESKVNYDRKSANLFRQGKCSKNNHFSSKYAVVFDAGSTGSRVHVYEFQFCGDKLLHLVDEVFEQTKPGLSAFPEDPDEAVQSLVPLLREAWRRVPRDLRRCTPIVLKATAGLRLLPSEKVANILGSVKSWLDDQPFHLPRSNSGFSSDPVSVIDGSEEAVSAWISVNFLQGHIGPERPNTTNSTTVTSVVLEMGGGSAQIVFDQKETKSIDYPGGVVDLKFFGRQFQLYQHSFLGYGLMEARKSVKNSFLEKPLKYFPCYPKGHEETFKNVKLVGNSEGWSACRKFVNLAIFAQVGNNKTFCQKTPCSIGGVHQPKIPENSPIYALSYFNDRIRDLGFDGAEGFTLNQINGRAETLCSTEMSKENVYEKNPAVCLDLAIIYGLLHDGYGIKGDRKINSGQTINEYETGWTLGSGLSVIETAPTFCS